MDERLQKVLARAGFGSRRACEELIAAGHVRVNGERAELGRRVDVATDRIQVRGVLVTLNEDVVYLALNKPAGVLTTARDPQGRPTVLDLVPSQPRVFPVGRLDRDTGGLLLLTNDGDFAQRVAHPRFGVPKVYVAEVSAPPAPRHVRALRSGIQLEDGPASAEDVRVTAARPGKGVLELQVREGRNRLVRRMLDAVGLPVVSLTRTSIGPVRLGRLKPGTYRVVRREEVLELLQTSEIQAPPAEKPPSRPAKRPRRRRSP